jgi:hypothetical protein
MPIKFVTKQMQESQIFEKERQTLIDALRILSWNQYKIDNPQYPKGLAGYNESFGDEWKNEPIQNKDLNEIKEFVVKLGYTIDELIEIRKQHYLEKQLIIQRVNEKRKLSGGNEYKEGNSDDYPPF